jgi:hypothetical protein
MTLKDFLLKLIKWVISTYWNNIASVRYFIGFISHLKLWNIIELHQKDAESKTLHFPGSEYSNERYDLSSLEK